ncbi:FAD NAD(P)-binding domain-containing protein [Fusarium napiforme]|uniref:FAD NAD(P)-binding domain-containing protein n=1 Tax=Fusarium napiforme TaxID=42672 RepID=A0A8H5N7Y0_9HYPO|nr:FAD NAD(P)-binding domain-containing protein [Fusarium napiforme]
MAGLKHSNGSKSWDSMITDHEVDNPRPMKVICIGAGISGILTGIQLPHQIQNLELVIYEKNHDVGGTWLENKYPGVRCDIPSPGYQLTFESNTQWSEFYACGPEIQQYMVNLAKRYDVYRFCKFNHTMTSAKWLEDVGKWEVTCINGAQEAVVNQADVLLMCTGMLNKWTWPNIPGLDQYKGVKVHTANWDPSIQIHDKRIALIGAGSTGIQLLPQLQPVANRIDHYVKGQNWISPLGIGGDELLRRNAVGGNFAHSKEELDEFSDEQQYLQFRHKIENDIMQPPLAAFKDTKEQKEFHKMSQEFMESKLKTRPDILEALMPDWAPGCRRLTPGPGYLDACCEANVEYISTPIKRVHENCIETVDGKKREIDLLICATGFDVSRQQGPKITGQGGRDLYDIWNPFPKAYMSMCPPQMPNMFIYFGPNGGPMTGSTMLMLEWVCDYAAASILKLQREYYRSMVIKPTAMDAFTRHAQKFFSKTVFSLGCTSWFKRGTEDGQIVANWPGSGVHSHKTLENPRWEDFDYEVMPEIRENILGWMGNGLTVAQAKRAFTTEYLDLKNSSSKRPKPVNPDISVSARFSPTAKNGSKSNGI